MRSLTLSRSQTETYLLNGHKFYSYSDALDYCAQNGLRITGTQALSNARFLLSATEIDPIQLWVDSVRGQTETNNPN